MATNSNHIEELIEKLNSLPTERISEVEDFIDFLKHREAGYQLTRSASKTAEQSFNKIWDNPDDAIYDSL